MFKRRVADLKRSGRRQISPSPPLNVFIVKSERRAWPPPAPPKNMDGFVLWRRSGGVPPKAGKAGRPKRPREFSAKNRGGPVHKALLDLEKRRDFGTDPPELCGGKSQKYFNNLAWRGREAGPSPPFFALAMVYSLFSMV